MMLIHNVCTVQYIHSSKRVSIYTFSLTIPNPKPSNNNNNKRLRQDSSDDDNNGAGQLVKVTKNKKKEKKKEGNNIFYYYPKTMLKEIAAVHRSLLQVDNDRARPTTSTSEEVFVIIHEEFVDYEDITFRVIGTYARVDAANEKVLKAFRIMHPQFLLEGRSGETSDSEASDGSVDDDDDDDGHFVKRCPREWYSYGFEVAWWIDEHGALSLRAQDRNGDVFKVYAVRQQVQP